MLLMANRLLPGAALHQMIRLMMGLPRFGRLAKLRRHGMADNRTVRFEQKMMIDGKLVDGGAGTFTNINPATEEPLGEVADASKADMHRAIDAARRAFDETDWSTNHSFRQRCLLQLQDASGVRTGGASRRAHPRSRLPAGDHPRPAARRAAGRRAQVPGQADRRLSVGDVAWRRVRVGHRCQHHPKSLAGTGRCGRGDRAVELPVRGHHPEDRPGARHGQHRRAQAGAAHPLQRNTIGQAHRRADRHPAGCGQRGHRFRPLCR